MNNTIVGVFDDVDKSEQAVEQLLNSGFSGYDLDVSRTKKSENFDTDEHKSGIRKFFDSLMGESDEAESYSSVAGRGSVITVHTDSKEEAQKAAAIMDRCGAVNPYDKSYKNYNQETEYNQGNIIGGSTGNAPYTNPSLYPEADSGINTYSDVDSLNKANYDTPLDVNTRPLVSDNSDDTIGLNINQSYEGEFSSKDEFNDLNEKSIPIIEENMEIGKREVETNEVKIRSRIFEKPVEEHLRLRSEYVNVERTPVNRVATPSDLENFKEGVIEMKETEEVPLIKKEAKVVEEVKIKKDSETKEKTIRGSVRRQDVDIEKNKKARETASDEEGDLI